MYDPKNDYIFTQNPAMRDRVFEPTADDPLCLRCGWPKHHHAMGPEGGGTGPLASGLTEDQCPGFKAAPLTAAQQDRSATLLEQARGPIIITRATRS